MSKRKCLITVTVTATGVVLDVLLDCKSQLRKEGLFSLFM